MYSANDYSQSNAETRAQAGRQRYHNQKASKHHYYSDEAWMHWEYSPEDWTLFDKVDWRPVRLTVWLLAAAFAVSIIFMILPWVISPPGADTSLLLVKMYIPALLAGSILFVVLTLSLFSYFDARKRHKARQQEPRTVTFSREGVWEAGTFFPLNKLLTADLKNVKLTFDPPVLHFRLLRWHIGKNWRSSPTTSILRVPIPRGHEEEAGFLLERFQTEVIQARTQFEKQVNNPPEPR